MTAVVDPELRLPITELDMLGDVRAAGGAVEVTVRLTIVGCPASDRIERDVRAAALGVDGVDTALVHLTVMTPAERHALTERLRGGRRGMPFTAESLTAVWAITSGKGGVGKSTLTANLAVELARRGLRVGVLDADVHGYSIPALLGIAPDVQPTRVDDLILPPVAHGVKAISIGMFLSRSRTADGSAPQAVAWRGPMLHRTIQQFLTDVHFGDLDALLLDLPPGTGDVAISVGQLLPHAEVLVVTTPQRAAADVAERSGLVARQTGQHVFGVVENMAGLVQPDGSVLALFGEGGGAETARRLSAGVKDGVPLVASVPLSVALREGGDTGRPIVLADPDNPASQQIAQVADAMISRRRGLAGRALPLGVR